MKAIILLPILLYSLHCQTSCMNSSFETGTFLNWGGSIGTSNICGDTASYHPTYTLLATGVHSTHINANILDSAAYHTIVNNSGIFTTSSGANIHFFTI